MEHFYNEIHGWFEYENFMIDMVSRLPNNAKIVEIGAWKGRSTSFISVECINSGKNIEYFVVDTWLGSNEHEHIHDGEISTLYDVFLKNTERIKDFIKPMKMTSVEASKHFKDGSLDYVYIDGSHEYEDVLDDIKHWYPKVKRGGIISGDDYLWNPVERAVNESFGILGVEFKIEGNEWYYEKL